MSFGALFAMSFVVLSVKGNWIEEVLDCRPDWCSRRWMTTYEGGVTVLFGPLFEPLFGLLFEPCIS